MTLECSGLLIDKFGAGRKLGEFDVEEFTWISSDDGCSSTEVARDIGVAVLLIVAVEYVGGMREECVRVVAGGAGLDDGAVSTTESAGPIKCVLEVRL
ncbi:hypothetical protein GW17_00029177 [Ensete ventricosum]|nr:hypothetical protein GW17_00029177 [Ensete ventricosum]